ncbi:MAG: uroporphyrinogen decarboxylase family protein [Candidatus Riflebacteria bacterium]|nr:uroporphyrinogen decarboxylase family protein [Candidatus Riflebacteria bacterium]
MNSIERVMAAYHGKPQSRPPYTLILSLYGARLIKANLHQYYRSPQIYLDGQKAVLDKFEPDLLFTPFALALEAEAFGSQLAFIPDDAPVIRKPAVNTPEDFLEKFTPDLQNSPGILYMRESARLLAQECNGKVPVCGVITSPVDLPLLIMGMDKWIETILFFPSKAREVLQMCSRHFVSLANSMFQDGINFIGITTALTNPKIFFQKQIDEIIMPALTDSLEKLNGPIVFHHGGSQILPLLPQYLKLPNLAAFVIDQRDSFASVREILGPNRLLLGNLFGPGLSRTPENIVIKNVEQILEDRKDDPFFIFCTSGPDVPIYTPPETIKAIIDTIQAVHK